MNFSGEIRRELIKTLPPKRCCQIALLRAFLDTSGSVRKGEESGAEFSFTSENERIAAYMLGVVEKLFGVPMTVAGAVRDPKHGRDKLTFRFGGEGAEDAVAEVIALAPSPCCMQAYLRGAFLGSGSCTLPGGDKKTGYHLEFVFRSRAQATALLDILDELQLIGSIVQRGEKYVVYCKSREAIADFLSVVGAESALNTLESVSAAREENNQENRVLNCLAGNADRAATASAEQTVAFEYFKNKGMLPALPEALRIAAEGRLAYPTLSLAELAEKLGLSKSCLNHRIRKLMKIYTENL